MKMRRIVVSRKACEPHQERGSGYCDNVLVQIIGDHLIVELGNGEVRQTLIENVVSRNETYIKNIYELTGFKVVLVVEHTDAGIYHAFDVYFYDGNDDDIKNFMVIPTLNGLKVVSQQGGFFHLKGRNVYDCIDELENLKGAR